MKKKLLLVFTIFLGFSFQVSSQHSVARDWNEEILNAIRGDFARPTVHSRNLFHSSVVMYDAWAIFDSEAETVFLGKTFGGYTCDFTGIQTPTDIDAAQHEVMSYAIYRLIYYRFINSPDVIEIHAAILSILNQYGYDENFTSADYSTGSYAALGNYLAEKMIEFGLQDGSNEINDYSNLHYQPLNNSPIILTQENQYNDINPNHWQPLAFETFIDQSGNEVPQNTPDFLGPEWGQVTPFALSPEDLDIYPVGDFDYYVYNNPGPPALMQNSIDTDGIEDPYKWGFALVGKWGSHLDPADNTMIDISPASIGNIQSYPTTFEEYQTFYDFENGGDASIGHNINPSTNQPYQPQMVLRADYARVLAEFWADGPESETPPGHWFTILNYVSDHPLVEKKFSGQGPILSNLEWDVKSYLALGGAMHDSAVDTWGIKGYYDYVRPISAIRYMAGNGQSTDNTLQNFHPQGLPLIDGFIEIVEIGDALAGANNEFVGRIKMYTWKGPNYIINPDTDIAGVGWILASNWWPYQRPTFVTPPFAGYVSGHSTFSAAAAKVLTRLTGDAFFPGGMGTFDVVQNEFLVFEEGPSASFTLQWATYKDASDQTSLSRIWGGIHPPIDDIPGRIIGEKVGIEAFDLAESYFYKDEDNDGFYSYEDCDDLDANTYPEATEIADNGIDEDCNGSDLYLQTKLYPIPFNNELTLHYNYTGVITVQLYDISGKMQISTTQTMVENSCVLNFNSNLSKGVYFIKAFTQDGLEILTKKILKL